jgi:hypothetical protein
LRSHFLGLRFEKSHSGFDTPESKPNVAF